MSIIGNPITLGTNGNPTAEDNDVIFIDYDGTIRYSYSAEEFLALTALPPLPVHDQLTGGGWNWTLADAKDYVQKYGMQVIGYNPYTKSDATEFDIELTDVRQCNVTMNFNQSVSNGVTINWGDLTPEETVSGTGGKTVTHLYAALGKYTISMRASNSCNLQGISGTSWFGSADSVKTILTAIRGGRGLVRFQWGAFAYYRALKTVSLSPDFLMNAWRSENSLFPGCLNLQAIVFPMGSKHADNLSDSVFNSCVSLRRVSFPKSFTNFNYYEFSSATLEKVAIPENSRIVTSAAGPFFQCYPIRRLAIGNGIETINGSTFTNLQSLTVLVIPQSVSSIGAACFQYLYSLNELKFNGTTPAAVANSNAFGSLPTTCLIYVPFSALAAYLTATNYPAPATYTYIGFAAYTSGATLPTQDETAAYNVTWYASKADAIAETNPITVGNGKEIYCRYAAVT